MSFLPVGYESPKGNSNYTRIEDGENRIRILSAPIIGWEDWIDKKPKRYRNEDKPSKPHDPEKPIKHFWSFIVWNYRTSKIEIYQCNQGSIRQRLESLSQDRDWGDPYHYDIKIAKSGQMMLTKYELNPCPSKPISDEVKQAFYVTPIDLQELFVGGDPFAATPEYRTKAFWEVVQEVPSGPETISKEQASVIEMKIEEHITGRDPMWRGQALSALKIGSFRDLEKRLYNGMIKKIEDKRAELETKKNSFIPDDEVPF